MTAGVRFHQSDTVDFIVVGAGAAGGIMAKELSVAGFTVIVLEQGPYLKADDFEHDEFKYFNQSFLSNRGDLQPQMFKAGPDAEPRLGGGGGPGVVYHRLVGGGSVMFTSNYWRFKELDFKERSLLGTIDGTGLADWPISYDDLEPYYTKAEWDLGVSGVPGPFDPPRSRPYPLPPSL